MIINATWMQLTQKCNILLWEVVLCFGRKNKNVHIPFYASKTDETFPFASNSYL